MSALVDLWKREMDGVMATITRDLRMHLSPDFDARQLIANAPGLTYEQRARMRERLHYVRRRALHRGLVLTDSAYLGEAHRLLAEVLP